MLSDKQILELVNQGAVAGIKKEADWYTASSPIQAASLDLHIGSIYMPMTAADEAGGESHPLAEYNLKTGETVLIKTQETLNLPKTIAGIAFPPSRFAVKALLVTNAGHIDPEYKGSLRFTLINMGHDLQRLVAGDRVGTLILFRTDGEPEKGWYSRTGAAGRDPNTADLKYLSKDFAEVVKRAEDIARKQVHEAELELKVVERRFNQSLGWAGLVVTLIGAIVFGFFSWYSPVTKLETKVDSVREEYTQTKQTEGRLEKLESAPKTEDLVGSLRSLEKRVNNLEKRGK